MSNRKPLSDYGLSAKRRLIELNQTQVWLADKVHEETGMYIDAGLLQKIWTGERKPERIVQSISGILGIEEAHVEGN